MQVCRGRAFPGRGAAGAKAPRQQQYVQRVGMWLRQSERGGRAGGGEVREVITDKTCTILEATVRTSVFTLGEMGNHWRVLSRRFIF